MWEYRDGEMWVREQKERRHVPYLSPPIVTIPTAFSRCAFSFAFARRLVASSCAARRVGCRSASREKALLSRQTTHASRLIGQRELLELGQRLRLTGPRFAVKHGSTC